MMHKKKIEKETEVEKKAKAHHEKIKVSVLYINIES